MRLSAISGTALWLALAETSITVIINKSCDFKGVDYDGYLGRAKKGLGK
jgi:hypothetical protein